MLKEIFNYSNSAMLDWLISNENNIIFLINYPCTKKSNVGYFVTHKSIYIYMYNKKN